MSDVETGIQYTGSISRRLGIGADQIKQITGHLYRGTATSDVQLGALKLIERLYAAWVAADEDAKVQKEFLDQADATLDAIFRGWKPQPPRAQPAEAKNG